MVFCTRQWCGRYILISNRTSQRSWLLSNARRLHPIRDFTIPTESRFPSEWISSSQYMRRPFSSVWNVSEFRDWKIWLAEWPFRSPDITTLGFFPCRILKDQVYRISVLKLSKLKRRITTAMKTITQGFFFSAWIYVEKQLRFHFRESGGHIQHRWVHLKHQ